MSFGAVMICLELGRNFILVDNNPQAIDTMKVRFKEVPGIEWVN
jgi:site-specific DNA-methyltransferase (adenine-specific)